MPAIQVARTDTFELQRQKINQIGQQIFNVTAGGSDLSTGNLKLGNGTKLLPSLSFDSQHDLGLYKPSSNRFGFVGSGKKIIDFDISKLISYKDFIVQQNTIINSGLSLNNAGSNYDPGVYTNVDVIGGTGDNATFNINVTEYIGTITNSGKNYNSGSFTGITLSGGSGSGNIVSFDVEEISGTIFGGSNYIPGNYQNVPLLDGSGTGALANIDITGTIGVNGTIASPGTGYSNHTNVTVQVLNVPVQTFVVTTVTNPGTPPPDNVYVIDGDTQPSLTLVRGNTYRFDISDPSMADHPLSFNNDIGQGLPSADFVVIPKGSRGQPGAFIDIIVKPTAQITSSYIYVCTVHPGMGGLISVVSGSQTTYGSGLFSVVSTSGGSVSSFNISDATSLNDYSVGDQVTFYTGDLSQSATGSGFSYIISGFSYNGSITGVQVVDSGSDYEINDVLTVSNTDLGGAGSGFTYTITTEPGIVKNLTFLDKGTGYSVSDTLSLPSGLSGVSTVIPGTKFNVSTTLNTASPQITVSSTNGIVAGMTVSGSQINVGQINQGTTVLSVDSSTTLTLSSNPTVSGTATLGFISPVLNQLSITDTSTLNIGDIIVVDSGSAILDEVTTVTNIIDATTLEFSPTSIQAGSAVINIIPPYGVGTTQFEYTINALGSVETYSVSNPGNGYAVGDLISVNPQSLTQPIEKTVTVSRISRINFLSGSQPVSGSIVAGNDVLNPDAQQPISSEVLEVFSSAGNITSIIVTGVSFLDGSNLIKSGSPSNVYVVDTVDDLGNRFFIDEVFNPNLQLYVGNTYKFDLSDSSVSSDEFALSQFPDGIWNKVENLTTSLSITTATISVSSSIGIIPGMLVTVISGDGALLPDTRVISINGIMLFYLKLH